MVRRAPQRTEGLPARLRQAVEYYGSVTSIASAIDRSEGAVRKWLRGDAEPNATDLRLLSKATGASVEWLIFGGENRYGAAGLMTFLAHSLHRRDCELRQKACVRWSQLSPARRKHLEQLAHEQVGTWLSAEGIARPEGGD